MNQFNRTLTVEQFVARQARQFSAGATDQVAEVFAAPLVLDFGTHRAVLETRRHVGLVLASHRARLRVRGMVQMTGRVEEARIAASGRAGVHIVWHHLDAAERAIGHTRVRYYMRPCPDRGWQVELVHYPGRYEMEFFDAVMKRSLVA